MNLDELIYKSVLRIKNNKLRNTIIINKEKNKEFEYYYAQLCQKSGLSFSSDVTELYCNYKNIKIEWEDEKNGLFGWFDMIPIDQILDMHNDMVEIAESVKESVNKDEDKAYLYKLNAISHMYPIFDFTSGDKICIDSTTNKIVFYNHSVNELWDGDINGLIIAANYDELIQKWSEILFLEGFWWHTEFDRCVDCNGIDLNNKFLRQIIDLK